MIEANNIYHGDCMELLPNIPDASVDMVLCDMPYGVIAQKWDTLLPLDELWAQYERVLKSKGVVALTCRQPFTSMLGASKYSWLKYEWIWIKNRPNGFQHAKNKPMDAHENVLIFSKGSIAHTNFSSNRMPYYPQGLIPVNRPNKVTRKGRNFGARPNQDGKIYTVEYTGYPNGILSFSKDEKMLHPTQKPVPLFEYLIKTYTNSNEIVLDNCLGSGTTAIAAINTSRQYIGIEKDEKYFAIALERIRKAQKACIQQTIEGMLA